MNRLIFSGLTIFALFSLMACAGAKISKPKHLPPLPEKINMIALAPSGGVLADAIGIELFGSGFKVIDSQETSNNMIRLNLNEIELFQPASLNKLRELGINAVLSVKSVSGYDNKPQSATVRVMSTKSFEIIAAVSWQNGRGGAQGSMADRSMRKDVVAASRQIAKALFEQLSR